MKKFLFKSLGTLTETGLEGPIVGGPVPYLLAAILEPQENPHIEDGWGEIPEGHGLRILEGLFTGPQDPNLPNIEDS